MFNWKPMSWREKASLRPRGKLAWRRRGVDLAVNSDALQIALH
jgi:hypothetical protein